MALESRLYWRSREENARKKALERDYSRSLEIKGIYQQMNAEIDKDISAFYQKYADKNGLSYAETQKKAAKLDMEEYSQKAKYYVANRKNKAIAFSETANQEMEIYNLTMKVNRLEMLKANIGLEMVNAFSDMEAYMQGELDAEALAEYTRQAGILGMTIDENAKNAKAMPDASFKQEGFIVKDVDEPFYHATFSDRIWTHYGELKANLDGLLSRALVNGEGSGKLIAELRKATGASEFNARRLIVTETARVRIEAQKNAMQAAGVIYYEYMALGDDPCADCQELDGQIFPVQDMKPGENAPPMHPFCHCATGAASNPNYDTWLDFLEKGGTTQEFYEEDLYD